MLFKKLPLVILLLAGLFAFQGPVESPRFQQVAQTELVISAHGNKPWRAFEARAIAAAIVTPPSEAIEYFIYNETVNSHPHQQVLYQSLVIDYQHHHASL